MIVGVVGSRDGANLEDVSAFMSALRRRDPSIVVVSGGARGVDRTAENMWIEMGGRVVSFRPVKVTENHWVIERLDLGPGIKGTRTVEEPSYADFTSAAVARNLLIASECDKLIVFQRDGSPSSGSSITAGFAKDQGKDVFVYTPAAPFRRVAA